MLNFAMTDTAKRCALCQQNKPLLESHFIPAAIYKNLIDPGGLIKNMVASNRSTASEESKQVKQYLLCQDCEIRFQQGGESWVLARRLMSDGTFLLRDLLQQTTAAGSKNGATFYTLNSVPGIEQERLLYFGVSVFWRAAVVDWRTPLGHYTRLSLQPVILEELRKYLVGIAPFPPSVSLTVVLSASPTPLQATTLPNVTYQDKDYRQFDFYMPGIGFTLLSGNVPEGLKAISISSNPHCVAIDPRLDQRINAAAAKHAEQSTATDRLQQKLDQSS